MWDKYSDNHTVKNDQYSDFKTEHVEITTDLTKPVSAPVTEIAWIKLKEGKDLDALSAFVKDLEQTINKEKGIHSSSWGLSVENKNVYVGILGWDTVDVSLTHFLLGSLRLTNFGLGPLGCSRGRHTCSYNFSESA